jgi:replicative DNA helicase
MNGSTPPTPPARPRPDVYPPTNEEAERNLLGACLLHHQVFEAVSRFCGRRDLSREAHRQVWDALAHQQATGGHPDWVTLPEALRAVGVTDEQVIADLWRDTGDWRIGCTTYDYVAITDWAKTIEALGVRRRLIKAAAPIASAGYDETDTDEAVRAAYQALGTATERTGPTGDVTLADAASEVFDRINAGETARGLPTGLPRIDEATNGLRPGEMTILAARTAHGKTALALQIARQIAGLGATVAYLSLEMDAQSLTERLVSTEAGVPVRDLLDGGGPDDGLERVTDAIGRLSELPITFSVTPAVTLADVKRTASRWADVGLCQVLVVDYLQLVSLGRGNGGNRAYEVGAVAQALRDLAQTHKIHVLALAQLSRAIEHRSDPHPVLADLRESGGLEQAADQVLLLWRPELFGNAESAQAAPGTAFVHLAKNRSGALAHEPLLFDAPTTRFRLLDDRHPAP